VLIVGEVSRFGTDLTEDIDCWAEGADVVPSNQLIINK
jgi:hypothetical protein